MSDHIKIAEAVIDTEIEGLEAVKNNLGQEFTDLVNLILDCKGRVILSGMGKSGHIANKICATLASTGTPAYSVHPGEASHGDLGMISKEDVVILLSNSGETKELSDIINYCKRFSIKLIGLVRRKESVLVEAADIAIVLPAVKEASDVDAPTTSTTMMLALGDAVAVALSKAKGFSKDDFSKFHPGGKLGSQFIKVEGIMRKGNDLPICNLSDLMSEVIITMSEKAMGCIAVLDNDDKLAGIVTDGDLRRNMANDLIDKTAGNIMGKNPRTVENTALALEAVSIMNEHNITAIFVVTDGKPVGAIHMHDCFKAGIV